MSHAMDHGQTCRSTSCNRVRITSLTGPAWIDRREGSKVKPPGKMRSGVIEKVASLASSSAAGCRRKIVFPYCVRSNTFRHSQKCQARSHYRYSGPGSFSSNSSLESNWKGRDFLHRGFTVGIGGTTCAVAKAIG
jgi:hypothetical protein